MMNNFRRSLLKVTSSRNHKIKNSLKIKYIYKWVRDNNWLNIGMPITQHQFSFIIRNMNKHIIDEFCNKGHIQFPHKMGDLELIMGDAKPFIKDGKVKIYKSIDWDKTLSLWEVDKEAQKTKQLVYREESTIYRIRYNKVKARFINQQYYYFFPNRQFKIYLSTLIKEGRIKGAYII